MKKLSNYFLLLLLSITILNFAACKKENIEEVIEIEEEEEEVVVETCDIIALETPHIQIDIDGENYLYTEDILPSEEGAFSTPVPQDYFRIMLHPRNQDDIHIRLNHDCLGNNTTIIGVFTYINRTEGFFYEFEDVTVNITTCGDNIMEGNFHHIIEENGVEKSICVTFKVVY